MAEKSEINTEFILIAVGIGVGVFALYKVVQGVKAAAGAVVGGVETAGKAVYSGAQTVLNPVSSGIATLFSPGPSTVGILGNVIFPNGTASPLSSYAVFTDQAGNVYVKDSGSTWQLGPSDADGDYSATYVSG